MYAPTLPGEKRVSVEFVLMHAVISVGNVE